MTESAKDRLARAIYHALPRGFEAQAVEEAYARGMLRKDSLVDGKVYVGYCRNAGKARWDAGRQRFVYRRVKFLDSFDEEIVHPEDDDGYDIFVPVSEAPQPHAD